VGLVGLALLTFIKNSQTPRLTAKCINSRSIACFLGKLDSVELPPKIPPLIYFEEEGKNMFID